MGPTEDPLGKYGLRNGVTFQLSRNSLCKIFGVDFFSLASSGPTVIIVAGGRGLECDHGGRARGHAGHVVWPAMMLIMMPEGRCGGGGQDASSVIPMVGRGWSPRCGRGGWGHFPRMQEWAGMGHRANGVWAGHASIEAGIVIGCERIVTRSGHGGCLPTWPRAGSTSSGRVV